MRTCKTMACSVPLELAELVEQKARNLGISKSTLVSLVLEANIREEGLQCLRVEKGVAREPK